MAKTIVINGKTYTERTINNMVVDGQTISEGYISQEYTDGGKMLNVDINIESSEEGAIFSQSSNLTNESIQVLNMNIETNKVDQPQEIKKLDENSLKNKIIKSIIKFLSKFIG